MSKITSREIRLASRPKGIPTAANFSLTQTEVKPLQEEEVLIRNLFMSVDPYMRGRLNAGKSYVPSFELGKPLDGGAVGEVIESRSREFKPGDAVTSNFGWREYFVASSKELHPVSREVQPLSVYLGALGMTGMTAWAGLNLVEVKASDVVFISGAAGAVGNVAGQLAKLRGCRVIGSAGSAEQVVAEIEAAGGGRATASFDSVATPRRWRTDRRHRARRVRHARSVRTGRRTRARGGHPQPPRPDQRSHRVPDPDHRLGRGRRDPEWYPA